MSKSTDEKTQTDLYRPLEEVGLSQKEARVYMALLPYRDIGSSKLIRATGLHGQFVYDSLQRLEELGLARHVIQNGRKKFSASTPKRILSLLDEKRLRFQNILMQLEEKFSGQHEQDFEVLQGEEAFVAYQLSFIESTPENGVIDVISGPNDRYFQILDSEGAADEYERKRSKKNIAIRYIGAKSQAEKFNKWEKDRPLWTYKIFPGLSTGLVDISIWPHAVMFVTFGNPLLSFVLLSKEVADGYREFFEALWNLSKK